MKRITQARRTKENQEIMKRCGNTEVKWAWHPLSLIHISFHEFSTFSSSTVSQKPLTVLWLFCQWSKIHTRTKPHSTQRNAKDCYLNRVRLSWYWQYVVVHRWCHVCLYCSRFSVFWDLSSHWDSDIKKVERSRINIRVNKLNKIIFTADPLPNYI